MTFNGVSLRANEIYPFDYKATEINGRQIHYVDEGEGPVVLLVHGQGNWSYHYRGVILRLRDRARIVCHDLFGWGLSDKPCASRQYTLENHVSTLFGLIEGLNLKGITVYCMDWGGPQALAYATTHPENMRGLVIGNTWAWSEHVPFLRSPRWRTRLSPMVRPLVTRISPVVNMLPTPVPGGDWDTPEAHEVANYPNRYASPAQTASSAFNRATQCSADHPLEHLRRTHRTFVQIEAGLSKLSHLPVRVLAPDDPVFPPQLQERWRRVFPNAPPLIPIPGHAHHAQASEQASDIIADAIASVLGEAATTEAPRPVR